MSDARLPSLNVLLPPPPTPPPPRAPCAPVRVSSHSNSIISVLIFNAHGAKTPTTTTTTTTKHKRPITQMAVFPTRFTLRQTSPRPNRPRRSASASGFRWWSRPQRGVAGRGSARCVCWCMCICVHHIQFVYCFVLRLHTEFWLFHRVSRDRRESVLISRDQLMLSPPPLQKYWMMTISYLCSLSTFVDFPHLWTQVSVPVYDGNQESK